MAISFAACPTPPHQQQQTHSSLKQEISIIIIIIVIFLLLFGRQPVIDDNGVSSPEKADFSLLILHLLSTPTTADDSAVMSDLAAAITPTPDGWSSSISYCKWPDVHCDNSGRVTIISLASMSLSGTLPSKLNSLSQLTVLSLQNNSFSGPLSSLANLDSNSFAYIPSSVFSGLSALHTLSLSGNLNLSSWPFPSELTGSPSLVSFYARSANIAGSIPDIFDSFPNLQNLRLSYNNLTGPLPASFSGSEIQNLWLNNQDLGLSGTLEVLSAMTQLSQVWLHANAFIGPIPDLSNGTNIFDLQLRDNQLTGPVPASVTSLPKLLNISLQNNKLQGPLPVFASGVKVVLGSTNSFCFSTPGPCDAQVTALLGVAGGFGYPMTLATPWTGNDACAPWSFVACENGKVTMVNLGKQHLAGIISPAFANLTSLRTLYMNDNNLTGTIPESLPALPSLKILNVSNNNLSGPVPAFNSSVTVILAGNLNIATNGSSPSGGGSGSESNSSSLSGGGDGEGGGRMVVQSQLV